MEIKRNSEMLEVIRRRYIVRQPLSDEQKTCTTCGEPMLTAEKSAGIFGITQRQIFQIIEANAAHYIETESGAVMICLSSVAKFLDEEREKL